jgi:fatty acid/phospholipid biosynthesis enzyme
MIRIALEAMGRDNAPQAEVHGAVQAAREFCLNRVNERIEEEIRTHAYHTATQRVVS